MKKALLVDDDSICNFLNTKMLQRLGFMNDIHTASNGREALELLSEYSERSKDFPDVILLDLNMPVMDGFAFLEAFQKLQLENINKIKIIIATSSNNPQDISRAKQMGISRYLTKPLQEESLSKALEECE
jgi:CheY-like chemotaxis protein